MLSFSLCPSNLAASLSCHTTEQVIHQKRNIINYPAALQSTYPFFFFYLLISTSKLEGVRHCECLGLSESCLLCLIPQSIYCTFIREIAFLQILN